jgi:hypothetical protein
MGYSARPSIRLQAGLFVYGAAQASMIAVLSMVGVMIHGGASEFRAAWDNLVKLEDGVQRIMAIFAIAGLSWYIPVITFRRWWERSIIKKNFVPECRTARLSSHKRVGFWLMFVASPVAAAISYPMYKNDALIVMTLVSLALVLLGVKMVNRKMPPNTPVWR